jgi:hypothetical protein
MGKDKTRWTTRAPTWREITATTIYHCGDFKGYNHGRHKAARGRADCPGGRDVMWGLQANQLRRIKWKGIILEQQSNQLRMIKIERDYPKLIVTYLVK